MDIYLYQVVIELITRHLISWWSHTYRSFCGTYLLFLEVVYLHQVHSYSLVRIVGADYFTRHRVFVKWNDPSTLFVVSLYICLMFHLCDYGADGIMCFRPYCIVCLMYLVIPLIHWGLNKMVGILYTAFLNAFLWIKIFEFWYWFYWNFFWGVKLITGQHWHRSWIYTERETSGYLN